MPDRLLIAEAAAPQSRMRRFVHDRRRRSSPVMSLRRVRPVHQACRRAARRSNCATLAGDQVAPRCRSRSPSIAPIPNRIVQPDERECALHARQACCPRSTCILRSSCRSTSRRSALARGSPQHLAIAEAQARPVRSWRHVGSFDAELSSGPAISRATVKQSVAPDQRNVGAIRVALLRGADQRQARCAIVSARPAVAPRVERGLGQHLHRLREPVAVQSRSAASTSALAAEVNRRLNALDQRRCRRAASTSSRSACSGRPGAAPRRRSCRRGAGDERLGESRSRPRRSCRRRPRRPRRRAPARRRRPRPPARRRARRCSLPWA